MKYLITSLILHSLLFVYILPNFNELKEIKSKDNVIKIKLKQISLKDEEKSIEGSYSNLDSKGNNEKSHQKKGIEHIDANTLRMKYFSFYIRAKNIIDYNWKKSLTKHFPKKNKINVFFELNKNGSLQDIIILTEDKVYKRELLANFLKIKIPNPPKDLFMKSNTMFLRWVFETK